MKFHDSVIMTISGIGYINGGLILGKSDDIRRLFSSDKLLVFADLDLTIYQSGNSGTKHTRMLNVV